MTIAQPASTCHVQPEKCTTSVKAALAYAGAGLRAIPGVLPKPGSPTRPAEPGWTAEHTLLDRMSYRTADGWFRRRNVLIVTGRYEGVATPVFALDIDNKPEQGRDGLASLTALELKLGELPRTAQVNTPSGGMHLYFRMPEGEEIHNSVDQAGSGVDVRGWHGYCVAPPSVKADGRQYEWAAPPVFVECPPAWVDYLRSLKSRKKPDASGAQGARPVAQTPTDVSEKRISGFAYSVLAKLATVRTGRNDATYNAALSISRKCEYYSVSEDFRENLRDQLVACAEDIGLATREAEPTVQRGWTAGEGSPSGFTGSDEQTSQPSKAEQAFFFTKVCRKIVEPVSGETLTDLYCKGVDPLYIKDSTPLSGDNAGSVNGKREQGVSDSLLTRVPLTTVECLLTPAGHALMPTARDSCAPDAPCAVLRWGTGRGKTHAVASEYLKLCEANPANPPRLLMIVPTTKLRAISAARLNASLPLEHRVVDAGNCRKDEASGNIVVCLQGLHKIKADPHRPLYVVVDEVEDCLSIFVGLTTRADDAPAHATAVTRRAAIDCLLSQLNGRATTVRLLDAYAGPGTQWLIDRLRFTHEEIVVLDAPAKNTDELVWRGQERAAWSTISEQLSKGEHVAIACGSLAAADAFCNLVQSMGKSVRLVTSERNIRPECGDEFQVDALIYTTAMGSGVSVDIKDWFNHRHVVMQKYLHAGMLGQMIARVRHPISHVVSLWGDRLTRQKPWLELPHTHLYRAQSLHAEQSERLAALGSKQAAAKLQEDCLDLSAVLAAYHYQRGMEWLVGFLANSAASPWRFSTRPAAVREEEMDAYDGAKSASGLAKINEAVHAEEFDLGNKAERVAYAHPSTPQEHARKVRTDVSGFLFDSADSATDEDLHRLLGMHDWKQKCATFAVMRLCGPDTGTWAAKLVEKLEGTSCADLLQAEAVLAPAVKGLLECMGVAVPLMLAKQAEVRISDEAIKQMNGLAWAEKKVVKEALAQAGIYAQRPALYRPDAGASAAAAVLSRCGLHTLQKSRKEKFRRLDISSIEFMYRMTDGIILQLTRAGS